MAMKTLSIALTAALLATAACAADPLPSWNNTAPWQAILEFVKKVTKRGSADYVPVEERIATFDNDDTLWAEQPMYFQLFFVVDRVKALAPQHPEWRTNEPFASALKGDMNGVVAFGVKGLLELTAATHAGMTTEVFTQIVKDWIRRRDGSIPGWFISRCSSCLPTSVPMASRLSLSRAAASSSCARGRREFMAFPRNKSSAAASKRSSSCRMASP